MFGRIVAVIAGAVALSLVAAGWHDVSQGYDVWYYHLPFAARLVGLTTPETYAFSLENQVRYEGFPLFAELLQGLFWRLTGHVQASNLVSVLSLFALPLALRRWFGVHPGVALLALLAIPLVQIHATAGYVDLPANAAVTLLLLLVYRVLAGVACTPRLLAGAGALAAAAANAKFQLVPIVGAAALVLLVVAVRRGLGSRQALVFAIALPCVLATPIKNTLRHGNPVWPVELRVAGHAFPYREGAYAQSPPHLVDAPRPVRFARSVLELDNAPIASHGRWSLDQWAPPSDRACRMGGYFGAYVVFQLVLLGLAARRSREGRVAAALFGGVTVVAALVPQSHELRYYMHWMLLLVALNLALWRQAFFAGAAIAALAIVAWSTGFGYLYPSGMTLPEYLAKRANASILRAREGERLCIARQPFTFLYAPLFHPGVHYRVQEWSAEADCTDAVKVP